MAIQAKGHREKGAGVSPINSPPNAAGPRIVVQGVGDAIGDRDSWVRGMLLVCLNAIGQRIRII